MLHAYCMSVNLQPMVQCRPMHIVHLFWWCITWEMCFMFCKRVDFPCIAPSQQTDNIPAMVQYRRLSWDSARISHTPSYEAMDTIAPWVRMPPSPAPCCTASKLLLFLSMLEPNIEKNGCKKQYIRPVSQWFTQSCCVLTIVRCYGGVFTCYY